MLALWKRGQERGLGVCGTDDTPCLGHLVKSFVHAVGAWMKICFPISEICILIFLDLTHTSREFVFRPDRRYKLTNV